MTTRQPARMRSRAHAFLPSLLMGVIWLASPLSALDLYISPRGDDAWSGDAARPNKNRTDGPFATPERARDEIRTRRAGGDQESVTVWFAEGIYPRNTPFELDERDAGTPDAPVIYRALENEQVRFVGGRIIPSRHAKPLTDDAIRQRIISVPARSDIRVIDLGALGITDYGTMKARGFRRPYVNPGMEVFIDGRPLHVARWPNRETVRIGDVLDPGSVPRVGDFRNRGGRFTYEFDRPGLWSHAQDIWLSGLFGVGYADDTIKVARIDHEKRTITMAQAHMYGIKTGREWLSYYALNLLEEIDEPGELFLDREAGRLYLYPIGPLKHAEIAVSILEEPMLCLEATSHVTFRDLTFEVSRGMGCYIERGADNTIAGCTFRNLGTVGVCVGKGIAPLKVYAHEGTGEPVSRELGSWHEHIYENAAYNREGGTRHLITGCDIYNTGAGGVSLGGGDRASLQPADNTVSNCHIHHFNRLDRSYKAAVNIDGCGNLVKHSLIHDGPNNAIYVHGNDHVIELNEIHHTCTHADDMGAFYMGRDPSERGIVIRWNFWHHNGSPVSGRHCDVYFDDGSSGVTVHGNVFHGARGWAAVFVHAGVYHRVTGNIFVDCNRAIRLGMWSPGKWQNWLQGALIRNRLTQLAQVTKPPYLTRYPTLARIYDEDYPRDSNLVQGNVLHKCPDIAHGPAALAGNWVTDVDPGFAQPEALDFRLEDLTHVRQYVPDFEGIPFGKIGLKLDEFRRSQPLRRPVVIPDDGNLVEGETVRVASRDTGVVLRYTLDGTTPGPSSPLYSQPLAIPDGKTISVKSFDSRMGAESDVTRVAIHVVVPGHPTNCTPDGWIGVDQVTAKKGVNVSTSVTHCDNGDWVAFGPFDFDAAGVTGIDAVVGIDPNYANQTTPLRLGAPDGLTVATVRWNSTGSFHIFKNQQFPIPETPQGKHALYWCFEGTNGVCNLKRFRFLVEPRNPQ
ncbi:MAG: carbohydrate-binding protein [Lentisphaerae bacterium]|nr:carbohydrate-binding protein [Lentisphaerota bacterium]